MSPVERLEHAFTVAKDQLAIERLLDPEGTVICRAIFINKQRCLMFYYILKSNKINYQLHFSKEIENKASSHVGPCHS